MRAALARFAMASSSVPAFVCQMPCSPDAKIALGVVPVMVSGVRLKAFRNPAMARRSAASMSQLGSWSNWVAWVRRRG